MEAATVPIEDTTEQPPQPEAEAQKPVTDLFRYSQFVHVGPGADECEGIERGDDGKVRAVKCEREDHFHAWCRLPNQFQQQDIVEKAQAAKARKLRALRNADSDQAAILELELDELRQLGDSARQPIIDEIVERDWQEDLMEAFRDTQEEEPFKHIDQDREELRRLEALPDDQRPVEEYTQLQEHIAAYGDKVQANLKQRQEPKRTSLQERPVEELLKFVERDRIERMGTETYLETYAFWSWLAGTMRPTRGPGGRFVERVYKDAQQLKGEAPEVVTALRDMFNSLEAAFGRGGALQGNS